MKVWALGEASQQYFLAVETLTLHGLPREEAGLVNNKTKASIYMQYFETKQTIINTPVVTGCLKIMNNSLKGQLEFCTYKLCVKHSSHYSPH